NVMSEQPRSTSPDEQRRSAPPGRGARDGTRTPPPWRTEGLPEGPRRPRWGRIALWALLGYVVFFGLLSVQDALLRPPTIAYTEFTAQVEAGNVEEVFARGDTIQG